MKTQDKFIDWANLSKWQPLLQLTPLTGNDVIISGEYKLHVVLNKEEVHDYVPIKIRVPSLYYQDPPTISTNGHKIPQDINYHINSNGTFCLAVPRVLKLFLMNQSTLRKYLETFLEPLLAKILIAQKHDLLKIDGDQMPHGEDGILEDIRRELGLKSINQVKYAIPLIEMKAKLADQKLCPCGCGKRLKKCRLNIKIRQMRSLCPRNQFRTFIGLK